MSSLIKIISECADIEQKLIESEGEITEEISSLLDVRDVSLPAKVDSYAAIIERMKVTAEHYKSKSDQFAKFAKAASAVEKRCKENMVYAMQSLDTKELNGNDSSFKLMKSPHSVIIENQESLPERFKSTVVTVTVDKKALIDELKKGVVVDGARLEQSEYIKIKVK